MLYSCCFFFQQGIVNIEKELERLQKKVESTQQNIGKLNKAITVPNYETKVPVDVQKSNSEKLTQLTAELETLNKAVQTLSIL